MCVLLYVYVVFGMWFFCMCYICVHYVGHMCCLYCMYIVFMCCMLNVLFSHCMCFVLYVSLVVCVSVCVNEKFFFVLISLSPGGLKWAFKYKIHCFWLSSWHLWLEINRLFPPTSRGN